MLAGKTVVMGICGGIAAYKAVDVASRLKKLNAQVKIIMTAGACEFVTPLTFRSITHNPVAVGLFGESTFWDIKHIELAAVADLFLVAPATFNMIGKVASGIADDLLSATLAATKAPVLFVPAMNTNMYTNEIFQANMDKLVKAGFYFLEPEDGAMACGTKGVGRFPPGEIIVEEVIRHLHVTDLDNINILVTAGPTQESIDPVRILTNRSSGKMGYAIALAAVRRGASVTLVSGPTNLAVPIGLKEFVGVESTQDMLREVLARYSQNDVLIKAAAPMDFRPGQYLDEKIKKEGKNDFSLHLIRNDDILARVGEDKKGLILVGFAAETENVIANAKEKLMAKNLDMIVANEVGREGTGFREDDNQAILIKTDDQLELPKMPKGGLADIILTETLKLINK